MPTKKRTISIVLDDDTARHFDDFRFNNRIKTDSKAGYMLLRAGMEALKEEYPELDMSVHLETGKKLESVLVETQKKPI